MVQVVRTVAAAPGHHCRRVAMTRMDFLYSPPLSGSCSMNSMGEVNHVGFRFGTWDQHSSCKSSNYREMRNLVDILEVMPPEGELSGCELFLFADNSPAE